MKKHRKFVILGLAALAFIAAAGLRNTFGTGIPSLELQKEGAEEAGYISGRNFASFAKHKAEKFATIEELARYAARTKVRVEVRDIWCAAFVRGFNDAHSH